MNVARLYLANPEALGLLAAVPLLAARAVLGTIRRRRDWAALGLAGRPPRDRAWTWIAAAACLIAALAQPRWGTPSHEVLPPGHDLIVAIDVSRSMGCEDVVPNRLGRAVEMASSLVESLGAGPGERAGVVAFAGRAVPTCPLTQSLGAVLERLQALRPGAVRPGGTDLAAALDAAAEAFDDQDHDGGRTALILSDGEDLAGAWPAALERFRARHPAVIVHTVAIGDADRGHPVPAGKPDGAVSGPVRYRGEVVLSRRSDAALRAIAKSTGGAFIPLGLATADMGRLYRDRIGPEARARRTQAASATAPERYAVFVLVALGLGLLASRPGWRRSKPSRGGVVLASLALLVACSAGADGVADVPAALVAKGRAAYDAGRFDEALAAFSRATDLAPNQPVARYDLAAARFQLGQYEAARDDYLAAWPQVDAGLRTRTDFALGNTSLALGDLEQAVRHYDDCLASTAPGAKLDEVRRRALANRRFVEGLMRRPPSPRDEGPGTAEPLPPKPGPEHQQPGQMGPSTDLPPSRGAGEASTNSRRGAGGAGGAGPAPPQPGSPEDRLRRALEHVREALAHRLEETAPAEVDHDSKDW